MSLKILISILYFVLASSFCVGDYEKCKVPYFTPNGPFDINRLKVLSTFGSDVSSRDGYYYNVSIGEGHGMIFALGLCIPGVEPERCSNCIQALSNSLIEKCVNQTNSYEYGTIDRTLCLVRYSDYHMFDALDQDPVSANCNQEDIANVTEFNSVWKDFVEDMIASAASKKYAAKVSPPMGFQRIYSLMMCIPGLSASNCEVCLRRSIPLYQKACGGRQGSNIRRPPCYFQWETYPFNDAFKDLNVLSQPTSSPDDLPVATKKNEKMVSTGIIVAINISVVIFVALLALTLVFLKRRLSCGTQNLETDDDITSPQSLQFDFKMIESATDNFSENNKIGQGGFGEVYMGILPNGTEVAVKRLSKNSGQGIQEFKNEVVLVAKLQHKNLVSLLGFCMEGDEQILVYEFVPNKSLDYFLFGPTERQHLDWRRRYNIIGGIARGILYLHQDSRFTIIHRDLKASNILLDDDMNPKIADFGMARIFGMEQTRANTSKIAGTFGYMAPEYAMRGQFSMKSDVYSFGVLVLEILSGKMNSSFYETDGSAGNLVTHAWRLWRKGLALKLLDPTFGENYQSDEVTRCIHIALLCVQEDPQDRPLMSTIVLLLSSNTITLEVPRAPGFFLQSTRDRDSEAEGLNSFGNPISCSINGTTVTELDPR